VPVTLELGGKKPGSSGGDADIKTAARRMPLGKFTNAGQTVSHPIPVVARGHKRQAVAGTAADHFTILWGKGGRSYDYGKIINEKRFDKLVSYLSQEK